MPLKTRAPLGLGDGNGLAGQRQLVDGRRLRDDVAVDRDDFAGLDDERIADLHALDWRIFDMVPDAAVGDARSAIDEGAQTALGSGYRDFLKHVAPGVHERDDRSGQRLTESKRRAHGNEGDGVDAEPSGGEVADDGDRKRDDHRDRGKRPAQPREFGPAGKIGRAAGPQADDGDRHQRPARYTFDRHRPLSTLRRRFGQAVRRRSECRRHPPRGHEAAASPRLGLQGRMRLPGLQSK